MRIAEDDRQLSDNFIKFLGTAGTRFVMITQQRATGGIWFKYGGACGVIDPGPGSLVRITQSVPRISAEDIDTLILTHKHIDHSCDINVLIEGMTLTRRGSKYGMLIATHDSLDGDAVVLGYAKGKLAVIKKHKDGKRRAISETATVESVVHHHHGVECFGLIFRAEGLPTWGVISDSEPMPHFAERYAECEMLVINTALPEPRGRIDHMSMKDVGELLTHISPKLVALTHLGRAMLELDQDEISERLSTERTTVVPAHDGMTIDL